ncbi:MAG: cupin domain-containing protein [Phycisphaerales bacterium]|nr:cupin domain-containing protein [Phycisphaerales bacterium]
MLSPGTGVSLGTLTLELPESAQPLGTRVLAGLVHMAEAAAASMQKTACGQPVALLGRLRGTGRGVSSSALFDALERDHPRELATPFEGSELVSGAVWIASELLGKRCETGVAKLRWAAGARDLPMHVHDHSDRLIIVRSGRGYFHVTDVPIESFTGTRVRSIPARERDVFLFSRGVVHTFSTEQEPMVLLSCQLPFLPFDDTRQYRLPKVRWVAQEHPTDANPRVACDPAWSVIGAQPRRKWWEGKAIPPLV